MASLACAFPRIFVWKSAASVYRALGLGGGIVVLLLALGCSAPPSPQQCIQDDDCSIGWLCNRGLCAAFEGSIPDGSPPETEPLPESSPEMNLVEHSCSFRPSAEICNGQDDDCDGQIDNHLSPPFCSKSFGVCAGAKKRCAGAWGWLDCTSADYAQHSGGKYQASETSCDGLDNDCDGVIDPQTLCVCENDERRPCYAGPEKTAGLGLCKAGTSICEAGRWGACLGQITPALETCDGQDNDCDGHVDETCFSSQASFVLQGKLWLPSFSASSLFLSWVDFEGRAHIFSLPSLSLVSSSAPLGGFLWLKGPQASLFVEPFLHAELPASGEISFSLFEKPLSPDRIKTFTLSAIDGIADLCFASAADSLYTLDPSKPALIASSLFSSSPGLLQRVPLSLPPPTSWPCYASRFAFPPDGAAILCPGLPPRAGRSLPIPDPAEHLQGAFQQKDLALLPDRHNASSLIRIPLPSPPLDIHFFPGETSLRLPTVLFLTVAGEPTSALPAERSGSLLLLRWPSASPRQIVPIPPSIPDRLARPLGVRTTPDGLVLLSIQEFQSSPPFAPLGGRLVTLALSDLLQGRFVPLQTFSLSSPPYYIALSPDLTTLVVSAPHPSNPTSEVLLLRR